MARTRTLFGTLTRRGPHQVLRGDLAFAGLPGAVYTPASGFRLPAVVFGHDWLTGAEHYAGTAEHLASWGIVEAVPDTQRGLAPSVLTLSYDLCSALDVVCGVRLGSGAVSVDPARLAVAGHGFGGTAAVFAAAARPDLKAGVAVFPSVTKPSATGAATTLTLPGLVLATPDDAASLRTEATEIARAWPQAQLRVVAKSQPAGLAEKHHLARLLGFPGSSSRTQRTVRSLLTGFLLFHLTGDKTYRVFADAEADLPRTRRPDPDAAPVGTEDQIVALLR